MNRESLVQILNGLGFDANAGTPLKCRCQPKERFGGDCVCLDRIIDAVMAELHWSGVIAPLSERELLALRGDPGSLCGSDIAVSGNIYFCDLSKDEHTVHYNEDANFSWSEV